MRCEESFKCRIGSRQTHCANLSGETTNLFLKILILSSQSTTHLERWIRANGSARNRGGPMDVKRATVAGIVGTAVMTISLL